MRIPSIQHRAYTYRVTVQPVGLPVDLGLFKEHIKRNGIAVEDNLLNLYLGAAVKYAEDFTRRDFIQRTYQTFRDFFPEPFQHEGYYTAGVIPSNSSSITSFDGNVGFEIRKSPLVSVSSINYINNNDVSTAVDSSIYYNTIEEDYSEILLVDGIAWPTDVKRRLQAITITFVCGMAADDTDIPEDIKNAIFQHATALWKNRGDCASVKSVGKFLPAAARATYLQHRIENL